MKRGGFTRRAFSLAAVHHRVGSGNRASMTYGNGVQTEYTYNKANLVSYLSNTKNAAVLSQYSYTYDLAGQQVSKTDHGGQQTAYTYNGIGQLTGEVQSQNSTNMHQYSYQYSAAQNRTQMDLDGVTTAYTYDVNNRLLTQTVGTAATNYTYDANGNQKTAETADGTLQYGYDGLNRMTAAAEPGMSSSYSYGANGLRTSKTVDGVTTTYVWDGDQIVLEQIGSTVRKYIRGLNLAAMVSGTDTSYYLYNAHGDVVQLTDGSGTITKNYAYDAFGCELFPSDTDVNPFRYCGEYYDLCSGTYYLRARYYSPSTGRFFAEDTFRGNPNDQLTLNLYIYCGNNPIRYYDPNGHFWEEIGGGLKWLGGKIYDGASALTDATLHASDWIASNVLGIDTAAVGAFFLMMDQDASGIYHARTDAWQQIGGYNSLYDAVFDFGTSMSASYYGFSHEGQNYRFWAWKGDYINLGAGAELGIYQQMTVAGFDTPQWGVNRNIAMKMSMSLSYQGNVIATYNPSDPQWWITSFNPDYKNVDASNLSVSFTVNFSGNTGMFDDFYNEWSGKSNTPWTFDKKNYTATLNY